MEHHGDLGVFARAIERQHLVDAGDRRADDIRLGVLILCGAHRGIYAAGALKELCRRGILRTLYAVGGVSAGSCIGSYGVSGQVATGASIYLEECLSRNFFNPLNALNSRPVLCLDYLSDVIRGKVGHKGLDVGAVMKSPTKLSFGTTDALTGEGLWFDAKKALPDLETGIRASIAIPFESEPIMVNGRQCLDGGIGCIFPAKQFVEEHDLTDLIVLTNRSFQFRENTFWKRWLESGFMSGLSEPLKAAIFRQDQAFDEGYEYLTSNTKCRSVMIFTDTAVRAFTQSRTALEAAMERSRSHLSGILDSVSTPSTRAA